MTTSDATTGTHDVATTIRDRLGAAFANHALTLCLFTSAIFTSAALMFVVQPMVGKILLPKLGGAPAVWNTCMLFFQATLLAGYLTAHLLSKYLPFRTQVVAYAIALMLALNSLPISVGTAWIDSLLSGREPTTWLLQVLLFRVAPVFFVLSTTSPLLQKWFAQSGHPQAHDPYFLYAASNVGSILSLLAYPLFIEVNWGVTYQTTSWMYGFAMFTVLATVCGVASWHSSQRTGSAQSSGAKLATPAQKVSEVLTWKRRAWWVLLALVPSSLMLGVTTYISTDVASIPLIWVVPLAMYLLTFVVAFSSRRFLSNHQLGRLAALLVLMVSITFIFGAVAPTFIIVPLHLLMFFTVGLLCHQRLADDRPSADHLTDFYLWLSVGGVLGGLFNAIIAPTLFVTLIEYPLVMLLGATLRQSDETAEAHPIKSSAWRVGMFGLAIMLVSLGLKAVCSALPTSWVGLLPITATQLETLLSVGIPAGIVLCLLDRKAYFSVGLGMILAVSIASNLLDTEVIQRSRNFYGTIATGSSQLAGKPGTKIFHGSTIHGWQWSAPELRGTPLSYFGRSSGVYKAISHKAAQKSNLKIGIIGLGAGTIASQARSGDEIVFYEINPQVCEHAEKHFTFLSDARARGANVDVRLGDARLVLEAEAHQHEPGRYDVLVCDAFSSDSIPAHLLTDECMQIYLKRTREDGILAFHVSNRFLDLEPVLATLASANDLAAFSYRSAGLVDGKPLKDVTGESPSWWVLIARDPKLIETMPDAPRLKPARLKAGLRLWTDDFTNVLSAFNLSQ